MGRVVTLLCATFQGKRQGHFSPCSVRTLALPAGDRPPGLPLCFHGSCKPWWQSRGASWGAEALASLLTQGHSTAVQGQHGLFKNPAVFLSKRLLCLLIHRKMTESSGKEKVKWITTVIMSSSLQSHEVAAILKNENHRVRFSNSVEPGSIIFSLSGIAFLLLNCQDCFMTTEETLLARIEKFKRIHRNSFLTLCSALHGPREWRLMSRIQQRFLGDNLRIIPVHNPSDAVKLMTTIAKSTCKPYADNIHYRMIMAKAQIIEQSPVWKTLRRIQLDCDSLNMN